MSDNKKSQFHRAEIAVQEKLGVADMVAKYSEGFVRPTMPEQHQEFFNNLFVINVAMVDRDGYPWALPLFGEPGFIQSQDDKTLEIATLPDLADILDLKFGVDQKIGLVGVELHTRRRNRMNGHIRRIDDKSFTVSVEQSFGNCPQYIQKRNLRLSTQRAKITRDKGLKLKRLISDSAVALISKADTFFIGSRTKIFSSDERCGIDASHRGGKPGFVKIEGDTLYFPDFSGNRFFNTLGNIKSDGRVGLYFPDFSKGHSVFISGDASIHWDEEAGLEFKGAERVISVKIRNSIFIENYLAMVGELEEMSPSLEHTGTWELIGSPDTSMQALKIINKCEESKDITSFYLAPQKNSSGLKGYTPGQFLPISIERAADKTSLKRSYTLSRAPDNDAYRISVKREEYGQASRILHDELNVGDIVNAGVPTGQFTLSNNDRSIVLLSGGVGITPLFAILDGLAREFEQGKPPKQVWFIHGTRNSDSIAFLSELAKMAQRYPWLKVHVAYSRPLANDMKMQSDINVSKGRIGIELLKKILTFDYYDFYLCGSEQFMRSIYADLLNTGIRKSNIFYEFFGQGSLEHDAIDEVATAQSAQVYFAKSNLTVEWKAADGTLLELAEKSGLQPMHSCRIGSCGSCSCSMRSGEVSYQKPTSYRPMDGEVLLCTARPSTDSGVIELDL